MSSHPLPPNPCLLAILLVVKTTSEPCIVFHYPPRPGEDNSHFKEIFRYDGEESSTSSSDSESQESAAESPKLIHEGEVQTGDSPPDVEETSSASPEKSGLSQEPSKLRWNDIFGLQSVLLAKLLCPAANCHKKRFELGLNDYAFLGWPVFAKSDGNWKKAKRARRSSSRSKATPDKAKGTSKQPVEHKLNTSDTGENNDTPSAATASVSQSETDNNGEFKDGQGTPGLDTKSKGKSKETKRLSDAGNSVPRTEKPLVMFNVVFVLKPPPLEYHLRLKDMYDNVVKKFGRALRWEQARSNFVAREAALIFSLTTHMNSSGGRF